MGNVIGRALIRSTGGGGGKRQLDQAAASQVIRIKEAEAAQAAALQASSSSSQDAVAGRDTQLPADDNDKQLQQLFRAIQSRPVDLYKDSKDREFMKRRRVTPEQKEAALIGRLDTRTLRLALEDSLRAAQEGGSVDVVQLARKYGADEVILQKTLQHCGLAFVEQAEDGRLEARIPAWKR